MNRVWFFILFAFALCGPASAQLNNGGFHAQFGVDADTKSGYLKYGPLTGILNSDDWFPSSATSGSGVIDTSNANYYRSLLQSGSNLSFAKRMTVPLYTNVNGKIWLDAIYNRDHTINASAPVPVDDTTIFTGGSKNGDDPALWHGTTGWVPDKTDLVDVFAHMRRNGTNVHDSLWFFTAVSTVGVSGSRYFDIELYKNKISYDRTAGSFTTGGPSGGHAQWLFDASGNITQTGDMIIAVSYSPGTIPSVEVRIWVSNTTYTSTIPALFNFGGSYNGSGSFGYASIVSKTGATAFGSGIANYSATPAADTTDAAPWGTYTLSGTTPQWSAKFTSLQLIEVGLNLTRIGLDPALYSSVLNSGACRSSFASIFFKSRSSPSFTSNLQDFVGPFDFLQVPTLDHSIASPPMLTCTNNTGTIQVTNRTTAGYYTWSTANGSITATTSNSVTVGKGGTYIMESSVAQGCPVTRRDTLTVQADTFPPYASFYSSSPDLAHFKMHGGDVNRSNYVTPFGGSRGLLWNWTGPRGFTSTVQNPVTDTATGNFQLIVTEVRNGCTDTATWYMYMRPLSGSALHLEAIALSNAVQLTWKPDDRDHARYFEIERSSNGGAFITQGRVEAQASNRSTQYIFTDNSPGNGSLIYRLRSVSANGEIIYSNTVTVDKRLQEKVFYVFRNNAGAQAVIEVAQATKAKIIICSLAGQTLHAKNIALQAGINRVQLSAGLHQRRQSYIVTVVIGDKPYSQQCLF